MCFGPNSSPIEKGICINNPLSLIFVNGVTVSNEPIDAPTPNSRYGATQGIGAVILVFPPIRNAFAVDLYSGAFCLLSSVFG